MEARGAQTSARNEQRIGPSAISRHAAGGTCGKRGGLEIGASHLDECLTTPTSK